MIAKVQISGITKDGQVGSGSFYSGPARTINVREWLTSAMDIHVALSGRAVSIAEPAAELSAAGPMVLPAPYVASARSARAAMLPGLRPQGSFTPHSLRASILITGSHDTCGVYISRVSNNLCKTARHIFCSFCGRRSSSLCDLLFECISTHRFVFACDRSDCMSVYS